MCHRSWKGGRLDTALFGSASGDELGKPTDRFVFVFRRWMGAFRPLLPEAEEGLLAAEEDVVVGQGKAGAVAAHG